MDNPPTIEELTDMIRRELEFVLAPGVYGWTVERYGPRGELEIASLRAETEGTGDVGRYLDGLPRDRAVSVPLVTNPRLAGMLARRGFIERERLMSIAGMMTWCKVWIRSAS